VSLTSHTSTKAEEGRLDDQFHVFVLKLWCEQGETEPALCVWRGSIENAETRRVAYFNNLAELVAFLDGHIAGPTAAADRQAQPRQHRR
jgi:hypothetical protein